MNRGTGIHVHQQPFTDLKIGDTFFDADYGDMIWNGKEWQSNTVTIVTEPKVDDLVHYIPFDGCNVSLITNGIIKGVNVGHVWVVYHCADDWENYRDYTGALTPLRRLYNGWIINPKTNSDETFIEE